jgi:hypothetical protein
MFLKRGFFYLNNFIFLMLIVCLTSLRSSICKPIDYNILLSLYWSFIFLFSKARTSSGVGFFYLGFPWLLPKLTPPVYCLMPPSFSIISIYLVIFLIRSFFSFWDFKYFSISFCWKISSYFSWGSGSSTSGQEKKSFYKWSKVLASLSLSNSLPKSKFLSTVSFEILLLIFYKLGYLLLFLGFGGKEGIFYDIDIVLDY